MYPAPLLTPAIDEAAVASSVLRVILDHFAVQDD